MTSLSVAEMTGIGALSALAEITVNQPTVAVKNALQEGRRVSFSPVALYRGFTMNACSIIPVTAVALGSHRLYTPIAQTLQPGEGPLHPVFGIGVAAAAGFTSCLVATPTETVVVQQQRTGQGLMHTIKSVYRQHGLLHGFFRGTLLVGYREALYAMGYLGIYPPLKAHLSSLDQLRDRPMVASVMTAAVAGGFAAVTSHPFDTVKTRMQAFLEVEKYADYRTGLSSWRAVMKDGGMQAMMSGGVARSTRVVTACLILNFTREALEENLVAFKERL